MLASSHELATHRKLDRGKAPNCDVAGQQGGVTYYHPRLGGLRRPQPIASRVFRSCEMEPEPMSLESAALRRVQPSQTLAVTMKARLLLRVGLVVFLLGVGVSVF